MMLWRFRIVLILLALLACSGRVRAYDPIVEDEKLLKENGVAVDSAGLLSYFRKLSPTDRDRKLLAGLVRQLGADNYEDREKAQKALLDWHLAAVESLRLGVDDPDPELRRRVQECLEQIETGPREQLPIAAARLLAVRKPALAVSTLLDYLPHARRGDIVDAVFDALVVLANRPGPALAALQPAVKDSLGLRRAAAGYVLGRMREQALHNAVLPLLSDRDPFVRFRSAQGLLAGQDRRSLPVLIDLLTEPADELRWHAEEVLFRLAGDQAPTLPAGNDTHSRLKQSQAWQKWWNENGQRINLARLAERPPFLSLTLVPEMHANKVWEFDRQGNVLWELNGLQCPIDAQVLPGGRVLVAELNGHKVTERDRSGKVLWQKEVNTPIACQRLASGQTFIGTNHKLITVTPDGKETWSYTPENGFFIHSVQRLPSGHYAMVSMAGVCREIDAQGKEIRSLPLPVQGSWSGIEGVPGGRYLVVNNGQGKVLEIDAHGKTVWECNIASACYATRLPTGNTLIVSNSKGLCEVDRNGKVLAEKPISTSLWRVHRR